MLAVQGTALFFAGLLIFFVFLRLHRRSRSPRGLARGGIGDIVLYISMVSSLFGLALVGQFGADPATSFDGTIGAEMAGIAVLSIVLVRLLYVPLPSKNEAD